MEAIEAGVHVVADKPFAPNAQAARTAAGIIASAQGNYAGFYTGFARAVRGAGPGPVPAADGIRTLECWMRPAAVRWKMR